MSQNTEVPEGLKLTWALWGFATLVTLACAPVAYSVAHQVQHLLGELMRSTSMLTRASIFVAARLWMLAAGLGVISAALMLWLPRHGRAIVAFQVLAFLASMAIMAQGMLAPFECMCDYDAGLSAASDALRAS